MTNICKRYDDFISNLFIFMPTFIQKGWDVCLRLCRPFSQKGACFFSDEIHAIQRKNIPSRRICHPPVIAYKDFQSAEFLHNRIIGL